MSRFRLSLVIAMLTLLLAACEPAATPLPAYVPPTPSPTPIPATMQPIRYALMPGTSERLPDYALIAASAQVELLTQPPSDEAIGQDFDIVAGYGERAGWELSPMLARAALVFNPALPPFDNPAVISVVREAVNPQPIVTALAIPGLEPAPRESPSLADTRAALANEGWPDGFDVHAASEPIPGNTVLAAQLGRFGINAEFALLPREELEAAFDMGRLHIALVTWAAEEERQAWVSRVGAENVIDLYTLPISYIAADGLNITFTQGGWPIAAR